MCNICGTYSSEAVNKGSESPLCDISVCMCTTDTEICTLLVIELQLSA